MKYSLLSGLLCIAIAGFSQIKMPEPEMILVEGGSFECGSNIGEKKRATSTHSYTQQFLHGQI